MGRDFLTILLAGYGNRGGPATARSALTAAMSSSTRPLWSSGIQRITVSCG
jgi:hypothetical protein